MKKLAIAALCVIGVCTLSGCGDKVTLTNEQNDMIAEYVAGSLLKHSYDNEWNYTKLNSAQAASKSSTSGSSATGNKQSSTMTGSAGTTTKAAGTGAQTTTGSSVSGSTVGSTSGAAATKASSLSETLGVSGVQISYNNISIGDRYPTDAYAICIPADNGCKVVAVEFTMKNTGSSAVNATTKTTSVTMKLNMGGSTYNQYKSMLKNDICGLDNVSIKAGESYTAVAIFQVPSDSAVKSSDIKLEVLSGTQSVETIAIQ